MSFHGASLAEALACPMPATMGSTNGAWMYPCSGTAFYGDIGNRSEVFETFARGSFPAATLPNFLHEATHHHCFDSIVGYVLLSARVAAQYGGGHRLTCESYKRPQACLENLSCCNRVAHASGLALLQPLAEGLAMYAQCDALPGNSPVASPIAFYVQHAYLQSEWGQIAEQVLGKPNAELSTELFAHAGTFISTERSRAGSLFARDAEILAEKPAAYEAYWRGYELIRTLADVVDPRHQDSDAALGFLCSYIFHDECLAAHIAQLGWSLFGNRQPEASVDAVHSYLCKRLRRLREDKRLREQAINENQRTLVQGGHPSNCSYARCPEYAPILQAFLTNYGLEQTARLSWPTSTKNRRNFRFGSFIADSIEVCRANGNIRCTFDDIVLEVDGLRSGFPQSRQTPSRKYEAVDGSPVVECIFLDGYQPALAFYNAHNLIGLADRTGKRGLASEEYEDRYGELSPAIAFWHDMTYRRLLWNPERDSPCGLYYHKRLEEAVAAGISLTSC